VKQGAPTGGAFSVARDASVEAPAWPPDKLHIISVLAAALRSVQGAENAPDSHSLVPIFSTPCFSGAFSYFDGFVEVCALTVVQHILISKFRPSLKLNLIEIIM
jgi:hypothetical protein